jgi:hypothetical protein
MTLRQAARLVLLVALGVCFDAAAGTTDAPRSFARWSAACQGDSFCTASTRIASSRAGGPYSFQLRVSRFASGNREIAFLAPAGGPAADAQIAVQVDSRQVLSLRPGLGYRRVGTSSTYLLDASTYAPLLEALLTGKRVALSYPGRSKRPSPSTASRVRCPTSGSANRRPRKPIRSRRR